MIVIVGCAGLGSNSGNPPATPPSNPGGPGSSSPAPQVAKVTPASGATCVATVVAVTATFNEALDPATINSTTFFISGVNATVAYDASSLTATLSPAAALQANTSFTVTLTTGIASSGGTHMASNFQSTFTTGPCTQPGSTTFVYFVNDAFASVSSTFPFKFNADGTLTASSATPFSDPRLISGQSGKFMVGVNPTFHLAAYPVDPQTGVPQAAVSTGNTIGGGLVSGNTIFQNTNGINVYSISSSGQLSLVPGSPFDAVTGTFFTKAYSGLRVVGSLLFGAFNTVKDAGDVGVFSIAPDGALTKKGDVGNGNTPLSWDVHPNGRFIYETSCCALEAFTFDANTGSSTMVQRVTLLSSSVPGQVLVDPSGKFLLMNDSGIRVFSIDQASGMLREVSGSPFVSGDSSMLRLGLDPSGHFLIVQRKNSVTVMSVNTATGALTQVGSPFVAANVSTFSFDPSGHFLVVEGTNAVNVLKFNAADGTLTQVGPTYMIGNNLQIIAFGTF